MTQVLQILAVAVMMRETVAQGRSGRDGCMK